MDAASLHRRTVEWWETRLDGIGADTWGDPTPCSEWTVRDLVNHVTGEELWTVPLMEGSTIEEVGDRFDGDVLGEKPLDTAHSAASAAADSIDGKAPLDGTVHLSYGEERAAEYVNQLAADHLIHGWDLAAATGADRTLDPELVAAVAEWFADHEESYRSAGAIADRVDSGGDPQADLLASFGRDANWSATT